MQCLAKNRASRPEDARAFVAALDACSDVAPWTVTEAEKWWRERRVREPERVKTARLPGSNTLTIDVASRGLSATPEHQAIAQGDGRHEERHRRV